MREAAEYLVRRLELPDWQLENHLNEMARDGWRLFAADGARFIFERPMMAAAAPYAPQQMPAPQPYFSGPTQAAVPFARPNVLTRRQTEVAHLISLGLNNRTIAAQLDLGEQSIKNMVSTIMKKLGAENRTQVALKYHDLFPVE